MSLIFCDVEADFEAPCPNMPDGGMTEFAAVEFESHKWFHGKPFALHTSDDERWWETADPEVELNQWYIVFVEFEKWLKQFRDRPIFVSDNPAYDWQWINYWFWHTLKRNPFGHSARRIGDFYAGLVGDFRAASKWKKLRITKHTHNPVDDATGNLEAFERMLKGER
jgi:hypothetical protein